ncbi:uncharacterized protein [Epargyreus clarus]|uniref:uncharacterized protein n=1 Tax=Epargyreus clarus TaxID=520877 RepID=UPI003C2B20F5
MDNSNLILDDVPVTGGIEVVPEKGGEREEAVEPRSSSAMSHEGSDNGGRFWLRKRNRVAASETSDEDSAVNSEPAKAPKISAARRGRGRPPTTGKKVGVVGAKGAENGVEAFRKVKTQERRSSPTIGGDTTEDALATELQDRVRASVEAISKVASSSKNLKGTSVKALRDAAAVISEAVGVLQRRTESEEVTRLRQANDRHRADNEQLRKELEELRREMAELRAEIRQGGTRVVEDPNSGITTDSPATGFASTSEAELERTIMLRVGTMVNARLEALEQRLPPEPRVRPPLAADKAKVVKLPAPRESSVAPMSQDEPAPSPTPKSQKGKKGKTNGKKPAPSPPQKEPRPLPPAPTSMDEGWSVVAKRRSKSTQPTVAQVAASGTGSSQPQRARSAALGSQSPQAKDARRRTRKPRPPRSSAVAIKLQPEALKKGVTYAAALAEAKEKIDLQGLGIESVKFKVSATGARILEIPGATSTEKADTLADKLRAALGEDAVVSRPVKCAELRVSGLDDAVSASEVAAAIARIGGCALASVKTGEIRRDHFGLGTLWLSCPVSAARKVADGGRVLVGWVSAKVSLLEARPLRCYRCLVIGHVREQCSGTVDRSGDCYRCGKSGHVARDCNAAAAHCTLCAAAKKPADHRLGGKSCTAPRSKGRKPPTVASTQSASGSSAGGSGNGVVVMES